MASLNKTMAKPFQGTYQGRPLTVERDGLFLPSTTSTRITAEPLPSYSPDDNPMAYLWKKTKKRAPPNQYCKECAALTVSLDKALAYFAMHSETVLCLFSHSAPFSLGL
jgi:hypothetical protein